MNRILTAGLTPSWQHVLELDGLRVNSVNRALSSQWFSAGKSVNAALAIRTLGGNVCTIFPGGGSNARRMAADLEQLGLEFKILPTDSEVRVCTTLVDHASGNITELVENGEPLLVDELQAWLALFRSESLLAEMVVVSGSLPRGTSFQLYEEMISSVPSGVPLILDFRGEGLRNCLKYRPLVIKPNREELEQTVGHALSTETEFLSACHSLNDQGAEWVVISDGPRALYAVSQSETLRLTPPIVTPDSGKTLCPIGCGDALTGALALALSYHRTMPDALSFAMEAAATNLLQLTSCRF